MLSREIISEELKTSTSAKYDCRVLLVLWTYVGSSSGDSDSSTQNSLRDSLPPCLLRTKRQKPYPYYLPQKLVAAEPAATGSLRINACCL